MVGFFKIIIFILSVSHFLISQEIPFGFIDFDLNEIKSDTSINVKSSSAFGPYRYSDNKNLNKSSLSTFYSRLGIKFLNNNKNNGQAVYAYLKYRFKEQFYAYSFSRVVKSPDEFLGFSGKIQERKRLGFEAGESDLSGIGFENNWIILQFGRGRQSWGAGNGIELALKESSSAYEYGLFSFNIGKFKSRYFHGFLENINNHNRYIVGKGIEWMNSKLILSFSEISIYSGFNRPLDISYLNPFSSHIEIEFNDRQNKIGTDAGNAVWQTSLDYYFNNNLRFSGNFVIDELILDEIEIDSGKVSGNAFSARLAWSPKINKNIFTFDISYIYVGTHTFRHEDGYNNFVHRGSPLGWEYGSDGDQIQMGIKHYSTKNYLAIISYNQIRIGSRSIIFDEYMPYDNYKKTKFPTPDIIKNQFFELKIKWWIKKNIIFGQQIKYFINDVSNSEIKLSINVFFNHLSHL